MSIAPPSSRDLSRVPADRLVELLRDRVQTGGVRLLELLGNDGPPGVDLDPSALSEDVVRTLADLMDEQVGMLLPRRVPVLVDLHGRRLYVGDRQDRLHWRRTVEDLCRRYLVLVNDVRQLPAGSRFVLRDGDLASITDATGVPVETLRVLVSREMAGLSVAARSGSRSHLILPAAGVLLSAATVGGLELLRRSSAGSDLLRQSGHTADGGAADQETAAPPGITSNRAADVFAGGRMVIPTLAPAPVIDDATVEATGRVGAVDGPPTGTPAAAFAPGPDSPEAIGAEALDLITYDWQAELEGWTIEFRDMEPGRLGYAFFAEQRIEIYVRSTQTPLEVASVIAHELGHAVDIALFDSEDRQTWLRARELESQAWWPEPGASSDFASGAGDWAESFAHWLLGDPSQSELGGVPSADQLDIVADLVDG